MIELSKTTPALAPLQRWCYFSLMLLAWCGLVWFGLQLSSYFSAFVMLFGVVILFVYLLLAPVNTIHRLLNKPAQAIFSKWYTRSDSKSWFQITAASVSHATRAFSILIVYLVFVVFVTVLSIRFVPLAVSQFSGFLNRIPSYMTQVEEWLTQQTWVEPIIGSAVTLSSSQQSVNRTVPDGSSKPKELSQAQKSGVIKDKIRHNFDNANQRVQGYVAAHINTGLSSIVSVLSSTLSGVIYALSGLVLLFYILLDGAKLRDGFLAILPSDQRETGDFIMMHFHRLMFAFVKSQLMLGIATGTYMTIVYSMFGVPYPFFLGGFFAISEILPVVGTWIGFTPGIIVLLFMSPVKLLLVFACSYTYQTIKDNIIAPKVVGDALGLHPVIVIISLLLCSQFAGLLGVVFAIPLASLVNVLLEYSKTKAFTQSA